MESQPVLFEAIRLFSARRLVDLRLVVPTGSAVLCLRGEYDGCGDFFSIGAEGLEYADIWGGISLGDALMFGAATQALSLAAKWEWLKGSVSGPALVVRAANADSWEAAMPFELYLVVANRFAFWAGADWGRESVRLNVPSV